MQHERPSPDPERRTLTVLVGLIVLAAALPRIAGIEFGLPVVLHMDELEPTGRAEQLLTVGRGAFTAGKAWRYPPLLAELLALDQLLRPCDGCEPADLILRGRWLSAIVSALAAGVLALATRRVGLPLWAVALAGLTFAWCPLLVRLGRYATPDSLMVAMVVFGVWAGAGVIAAGRWRDYLLAGVAVGLAAAAKYNAALIAVLVITGHLLARPKDRGAWLRLFAAGALSLVCFAVVIAWPFAGFDIFVNGLRYEWRHYGRGHDGFDCANAAWEALRYLFGFALGPMAGVGLGLGVFALIRRARAEPARELAARRLAIASLAFVLVYLALLARQNVFFARVAAPMIPALAVGLAVAGHALCEACVARLGPAKRPLVITLIIGLSLLPPTIATARQVQGLRDPDTRLLAYRWMDEHLREGDIKLAALPRSATRIVPDGIESIYPYEGMTVRRMRQIGITHVVFNAGSIERFRWRPEDNVESLAQWEDLHEQLRANGELVQRFEHAPLPGSDHFGDSSRTIHHSTVEVWQLRP